MTDPEGLWPDTSGCKASPQTVDTATWSATPAFAGFQAPNRGYFSFPLSIPYLPFECAFDGDACTGLLVPRAEWLAFTEQLFHEVGVHYAQNFSYIRRVGRFHVASAYSAIQLVVNNSDPSPKTLWIYWGLIQEFNKLIARIYGATTPLDEAHAILYTRERLEASSFYQEHGGDSLRYETEACEAAAAHGGEAFSDLYDVLNQLHWQLGERLTTTVYEFSLPPLQLDPTTGGYRLLYTVDNAAEHTQRVTKELKRVYQLTLQHEDLRRSSNAELLSLLAYSLPGFQDRLERFARDRQSMESHAKEFAKLPGAGGLPTIALDLAPRNGITQGQFVPLGDELALFLCPVESLSREHPFVLFFGRVGQPNGFELGLGAHYRAAATKRDEHSQAVVTLLLLEHFRLLIARRSLRGQLLYNLIGLHDVVNREAYHQLLQRIYEEGERIQDMWGEYFEGWEDPQWAY